MPRLVLIAVALFSCPACVPTIAHYYLPVQPTDQFEYRVCGTMPYGGYLRFFSEGESIEILGTPSNEGTLLSVKITVPEGKTVSLTSNEIVVSVAQGNDIRLQLAIFPPIKPRAPSISGSEVVWKEPAVTYPSPIGLTLNEFQGFTVMPGPALPRIRISMPQLVIDGIERQIEAFEFERVKKFGLKC